LRDGAANLLGEDSLHRRYPATARGQQRLTRWGTGSHWENATLFAFTNGNELTPAAEFLRRIRGL
jgi:hypothetical protein